MIIDYDEQYAQDVSRLLKDNTARLVWGNNAEKTVVAITSGKVVGVASLYTNEIHPNRDYIGVYVDTVYRRQGLGTDLVNELKEKTDTSDFQAAISSKNKEGTLFLKSLEFKLARKCYTPDLKKVSATRSTVVKGVVRSVEQVDETVKVQLVSLQLENYKLTHKAINPLNETISVISWRNLIFEELDQRQSMLLIANNRIEAYILCYGIEDNDEIEIGYIGGRESEAIKSYLPFYTKVIDGLISQYNTVSIEADTVDPFAYAAVNCYEYDPGESLDTYVT
ncbi:GNAT family N-acetyltransferase [Alkalibacterium olivapovliticus]|uniref:Acetyltransferase (GNAT) family protein n=1 Tax=Alkalibacterium olivapovliticus TaxID=99907 RepID=A0A2T0W8R9_9LACT|nr:GNAT family N-acetyltransferase [Alkalibacterium olivapovliticus]PRY83102.1 acetyltransferase (GNAT) family protein [Alkalibacterium olivapovliticus]